jgi:hypothetical protein
MAGFIKRDKQRIFNMRSADEQQMILFLANKNYQGPAGVQFMGQVRPQPKAKEPSLVGGVATNGQILLLTGTGINGPVWTAYSRPCEPKIPTAIPTPAPKIKADPSNRKPAFNLTDDAQSDNDLFRAQDRNSGN